MLRRHSISCGLSKPVGPRYWGEIVDFLENCVTSGSKWLVQDFRLDGDGTRDVVRLKASMDCAGKKKTNIPLVEPLAEALDDGDDAEACTVCSL